MICPVNPSHLQVTTTPQLATVSLQARLAPRSEKLHGAANYHVFRLYTVYVHYVHYMFIICSLCSCLILCCIKTITCEYVGIRYDQMIRQRTKRPLLADEVPFRVCHPMLEVQLGRWKYPP